MTKLIINADDLGFSKGVNLGIIEAHKNGVVSSATLMVNMEGTKHAVKLVEKNKDLGVGIHFVLDMGLPVNRNVPSLLNSNGRFLSRELLLKKANPEEIEIELESQLKKIIDFDINPTHIDSHHHIHESELVFPIVKKIAKKYKLPIRRFNTESKKINSSDNIKTVDYFSDEFYGENFNDNSMYKILNKAQFYKTAEIMTHPAYVDNSLLEGSSYNVQRVQELAILTGLKLKNYIKENEFTIINYKNL